MPLSRVFALIIDKLAQLHFIQIGNAQPLRFVCQIRIEVRAIPVRVGNPVMRTGCHQQLIFPFHSPALSGA